MHMLLSNTAVQCMQATPGYPSHKLHIYTQGIQQETNPMSVTRDLPRSIWGVEFGGGDSR